MKNLFNSVLVKKPKTNTFNLTHDVKMSGKMGNLIPCCLMEAVPGDKFNVASELMIRFAPLIAPVMHRMDATVHYFFVPNRILWENWKEFIVNEPTGGLPYLTVDSSWTSEQKAFADYLGIPPCPAGGTATQVNALPFAAYQAIYNEYYRDQNLVPEVDYHLQDGSNDAFRSTLASMRKRSWEHDYFTSSLPFPQKGQAVDIPLGEVKLKDSWDTQGTPFFEVPGGDYAGSIQNEVIPGGDKFISVNNAGGQYDPAAYNPSGTLEVGATTINELRRAFKLQEWLEKNARGGTRYIENILMHFGVRSSDKRLQRPEYITGAKTPVVISEIVNTTGEVDGLPQGNMAGHGVAVGGGYNGSYYCEEHGYIVGILSIMPKTAYQQGIHRTFTKFDPLDYYWPSFANIGEQEVKLKELYAYTSDAEDTFGYVPRYAEYKFLSNRVAGEFRTTLNYWHLGRIFSTQPGLNGAFLECTDEDVERIFAVQSGEDYLYMQILNKVIVRRPMPVYGTPMF